MKKKIIGAATTIENLRAASLTADDAYQRDFNSRRAAAMGDALDVSRIGVLTVSRRANGTVVIVDGMHRHGAMIHAGLGEGLVRCEVHHGLSLSEEAALFRKLNSGRTGVNALDDHKAALTARDPLAMEIHDIVTRLDLTVGGGEQDRNIQAISTVRFVHTRNRNLERTLRILAGWDVRAQTYQADVLKSVSIFLAHHDNREDSPGVSDAHLTAALKRMDPESVVVAIKRRNDGRVIKFPEAACWVLCDLYNKKRGGKHRLPPYSRAEAEASE